MGTVTIQEPGNGDVMKVNNQTRTTYQTNQRPPKEVQARRPFILRWNRKDGLAEPFTQIVALELLPHGCHVRRCLDAVVQEAIPPSDVPAVTVEAGEENGVRACRQKGLH